MLETAVLLVASIVVLVVAPLAIRRDERGRGR